MPLPNHCIECDKPTMNPSSLCDDCEAEEFNAHLWDVRKEEGKQDEFFKGTNVPVGRGQNHPLDDEDEECGAE